MKISKLLKKGLLCIYLMSTNVSVHLWFECVSQKRPNAYKNILTLRFYY